MNLSYPTKMPWTIVYKGGVFSSCSEDLVIYTLEGSKVDEYAKKNGHKVEYIQTF